MTDQVRTAQADPPLAAEVRLAAAFRRIAATRMAGLPINHPALAVEAAGFRTWEGKRVGILIAPWAINLVLMPLAGTEFRVLSADVRQCWRFPSGDYDFMGGKEPECGPYHFCSLFSPVPEDAFPDQASVHALVGELMAELFHVPAAAAAAENHAQSREEARLHGRSALAAPLSRRAFLCGGRLG